MSLLFSSLLAFESSLLLLVSLIMSDIPAIANAVTSFPTHSGISAITSAVSVTAAVSFLSVS